MWPEYWSAEELLKTKASIPVSNWNAQYMQSPTGEEGALIKRDWWQDWTKKYPPKLDYIIQSYDTAFTKGTKPITLLLLLGVYSTPKMEHKILYLVNAFKGRYEFPELRRLCLSRIFGMATGHGNHRS